MNRIIIVLMGLFVFNNTALSEVENIGDVWGNKSKNLTRPLIQAIVSTAYPSFVANDFKKHSISVFEIDLDSDGKQDFIVHHNSSFKTCFIKSDNSKKFCEKLGYGDGFRYYWFIQLNDTPMLELFSMAGGEDYDDYQLYGFNPDTWERVKILKISPIILAKGKNYNGIYWGYPWDIKGIDIKYINGKIALGSSFEAKKLESLLYESTIDTIVFFSGVPTQGAPDGSFNFLKREKKYVTLDELVSNQFKIDNKKHNKALK